MDKNEYQDRLHQVLSKLREKGCITGFVEKSDLDMDEIRKRTGIDMSADEVGAIKVNMTAVESSLENRALFQELQELINSNNAENGIVVADASGMIKKSRPDEGARSFRESVDQARANVPEGYTTRLRAPYLEKYISRDLLNRMIAAGMKDIGECFRGSPQDLAEQLKMDINEYFSFTSGVGELIESVPLAMIDMERCSSSPKEVFGPFGDFMKLRWTFACGEDDSQPMPPEYTFIAEKFDNYGITWGWLTGFVLRTAPKNYIQELQLALKEDFGIDESCLSVATMEITQAIAMFIKISQEIDAKTAAQVTAMEAIQKASGKPAPQTKRVIPIIDICDPVVPTIVGPDHMPKIVSSGIKTLNELTGEDDFSTPNGVTMSGVIGRVRRGVLRDFFHFLVCDSKTCSLGYAEMLEQNPELHDVLKQGAMEHLKFKAAQTGSVVGERENFSFDELRARFFESAPGGASLH